MAFELNGFAWGEISPFIAVTLQGNDHVSLIKALFETMIFFFSRWDMDLFPGGYNFGRIASIASGGTWGIIPGLVSGQ